MCELLFTECWASAAYKTCMSPSIWTGPASALCFVSSLFIVWVASSLGTVLNCYLCLGNFGVEQFALRVFYVSVS